MNLIDEINHLDNMMKYFKMKKNPLNNIMKYLLFLKKKNDILFLIPFGKF